MKLIKPCYKYKESYYDFVREVIKNDEGTELGQSYRENEPFNKMIQRLRYRSKGIFLEHGETKASLYWIIENSQVIGSIDLREIFNQIYYFKYGSVAYIIKPSERNKGYATKALNKIIQIAKRKTNLNVLLLVCLKNNVASNKVIANNKGILSEVSELHSRKVNRYFINLQNPNKKIDVKDNQLLASILEKNNYILTKTTKNKIKTEKYIIIDNIKNNYDSSLKINKKIFNKKAKIIETVSYKGKQYSDILEGHISSIKCQKGKYGEPIDYYFIPNFQEKHLAEYDFIERPLSRYFKLLDYINNEK